MPVAQVFTSVSAALQAVEKMAVGQRIVVMGRNAHVVNGIGCKTVQYDKQSLSATARPVDGRAFNRVNNGLVSMKEAE